MASEVSEDSDIILYPSKKEENVSECPLSKSSTFILFKCSDGVNEAYISHMIMVAYNLLKFIFIFIKMMANYNVYRHTVPLFHFHI